MYTLKIKNHLGEIYELTHNRRYAIMSVSGLLLPQCDINTTPAGTQDGDEYSSSRLNRRNIVINMVLQGDIEANRQQLYTIFPLHSPVTVFFRTANRDLQIDGYLEIIDGSPFEKRESVQISIVCPDPYFRDAQEITAQTTGGACVLRNRGDVDIGFVGEITVSTEDAPELTMEETQSASPADLRAHDALLGSSLFHALDLSTTTVNVYVNGSLRDPADYSAEIVALSDTQSDTLWLRFPDTSLVNAKLYVEIIRVTGQTLTDMRYWSSGSFVQSSYVTIDSVPWYDPAKDCIVWAYVSGAVGAAVPKSVQATQKSDGTFSLAVEFYDAVLTNRIELRVYHSMGGTDVSGAEILRSLTGTWSFGATTTYIVDPDMPQYDDSRDILHVYMGDTLLGSGDYHFFTITRPDSSVLTGFDIDGDKTIRERLTFEVISSIHGDDIRGYTQEQIDEGMCLVTGLTVTDATTGEYMTFSSAQFRSGDKIEISTVSGDLHAVVTASTWQPVGKSLIRDVLKNGSSFFKLAPGENRLAITADTNADYCEAAFTAQQLYGGV
ncbi:MAG: phage tail family protein [Lachnospiraceae bacterium]|nr:phage tail family protein [Lachnospiraceae bacterium]